MITVFKANLKRQISTCLKAGTSFQCSTFHHSTIIQQRKQDFEDFDDGLVDHQPQDYGPNSLPNLDMFDVLAKPPNNIDSVLENGFALSSGIQITSPNAKNEPIGMILIGGTALKWNLADLNEKDKCVVKGLDKGIVEIDEDALGLFRLIHPKPDLVVFGLGKKARILGPKTRNFLAGLGLRLEISNTVCIIRSFKTQHDTI